MFFPVQDKHLIFPNVYLVLSCALMALMQTEYRGQIPSWLANNVQHYTLVEMRMRGTANDGWAIGVYSRSPTNSSQRV